MAALDFLKKCPGIFKMGLILLLGVVLLALASSGGKESQKQVAEQPALSEYGAALEERLLGICTQVAGVGNARVMLTFESGEEALYQGTTRIGSVPPRVMGVVVLCSGARDSSVRTALTEMLSALLGIGASRICVLPLAK